MALIDELKAQHKQAWAAREKALAFADTHTRRADEFRLRIEDLDICIAALEPPAEATPEPEPEPQDDASEFADSDPDAGFDAPNGETHFDEAAEAAAREEGPEWNEPEPTKPEADSIAKALDHYDPKAVAERDRFNPFNIFKREGDQ